MKCHWFVAQSEQDTDHHPSASNRWLTQVRRFAEATLAEPEDELIIYSLPAFQVAARLRHQSPAVTLWSLESPADLQSQLRVLQSIVQNAPPTNLLHLVAIDPRFPNSTRIQLSEWGLLLLDRPESLPREVPRIQRFWQGTAIRK